MKRHVFISIINCIIICKTASAQSWSINGNNLTTTGKLGSTGNFDVKLITYNNTRILIKANGNIGIGTATPAYKLDIGGTMHIRKGSGTGVDSPQIVLDGAGTNNQFIQFQNNYTRTGVIGFDGSTNGIVFNADATNGSALSMVLKSGGNVGIGTLTPRDKLDVQGNEILNGNLSFGTDQRSILFHNPQSISSKSMMYMFDNDQSFKRMVISHSPGSANWGLEYDDPNDAFNFLRGGVQVFNVDLKNQRMSMFGNVGIQTVAQSNRTLQVGNTQGSLLGVGTTEYIQDVGSNTFGVHSFWCPVTDDGWSLGKSTLRWSNVWAVDGVIQTSDIRDKTNIRDLNYGLKEIMQLHAIKFNWKNNINEGDKLGVAAQEIKKVLPEVVRNWEYNVDEKTGTKTKVPSQKLGVIYTDIIPVLIKSIQELSNQNDALEKNYTAKIDELKKQVDELKNLFAHTNASAKITTVKNIPNPVKNSTVIYYNIGNSKNAQLNITDAAGKIIRQINLSPNSNSINIECSTLSSGVYYYSLIVNNAITASNKMIVVK